MDQNHPLPIGALIEFDIAQGHAVGKGIIAAAEWDDGWLYRLETLDGNAAAAHRNERGELWACDFEVRGV